MRALPHFGRCGLRVVALRKPLVERFWGFLGFLPSLFRAQDCACAGACSGRHGGRLGSRRAVDGWLLTGSVYTETSKGEACGF